MTNQELLATIKNIVAVYLPEKTSNLSESTRLVDDLGINSARFVDIVLDLEDKFGISVPDSEMNKMATIGDAVRLVSSLLAGSQVAVVESSAAD